MSENEMIERVAKAIATALLGSAVDSEDYVSDLGYGDFPILVDGHVNPTVIARAAIEALREPTEAMIEAGLTDPYLDAGVWRAMIDAALRST